MGWFYDKPECYDHEGYVVALTYRANDRTSELFRELGYPDKATYESAAIPRIQAGCGCGWRSPYLIPERGAYQGSESVFHLPRWSPCSAWVTERDEQRCRDLWDEHVHHAVPRADSVSACDGMVDNGSGNDGGLDRCTDGRQHPWPVESRAARNP